MYKSLKDKLGFVYSFNMIFIFLAIFAAIAIDGFAFGFATAAMLTFTFAGFGGWLIYRIDRCQETFVNQIN